ncbi:NAD/NADP octopine/nopaline dehydrogenase [Sclerotinia borealis F-4128]|uniref:NAD/NADP octopine/nopaline dehydrogenase n=1 Tax=Sclerotinia borealis (strain F-4128) TaxID=1432307 RepID=W9CGH8_SCLBF|nr:NAD/NADP octopine/nopaline dehydrogenase [Sclerotinia borealis F-4128]
MTHPISISISIIGGGPAGFALAADLATHGHNILIYTHPLHTQHASHVLSAGHLLSRGVIEGATHPQMTNDMDDVVSFSKIIIVTVPSTGQEDIVGELRGRDRRGRDLREHTLVVVPGNLFGLVFCGGVLGEDGEGDGKEKRLNVRCVLETNLSPYSCRMVRGEVSVLGKKNRFSIAPLGGIIDAGLKEEIDAIFPMRLHWCRNVVEVCLLNINGVFHPLMMLMNAGRIESPDPFLLYHTGLTPSISNAILALDKTRLEIGAALGFHLDSVLDVSNTCYDAQFTNLVDLARNSKPHNTIEAPRTFDNRYITEDVPDLLVPWLVLAGILGVEKVKVRAVVEMAGMAMGRDYGVEGRGLERLGLVGVERGELSGLRSDDEDL